MPQPHTSVWGCPKVQLPSAAELDKKDYICGFNLNYTNIFASLLIAISTL